MNTGSQELIKKPTKTNQLLNCSIVHVQFNPISTGSACKANGQVYSIQL